MSAVLLTGANGFAGVYISWALAEAGHEVYAVVRPESIVRLKNHPNIRVLRADLSTKLCLSVDPEFVVHAAANSDPKACTKLQIRDTAMVAENVIEFAVGKNVKAFIYLSSLSIYGKISTPVVNEETSRHDVEPYGLAKFLGECLLADVAKVMPSISLRLPGLVGPGAKGAWLSRVVDAVLNNANVIINNGQALFNNVIHIDGLAKYIVELVEGGIWQGATVATLGTAEPITIREVVECLVRTADANSEILDNGNNGCPFIISNESAMKLRYWPDETRQVLKKYVREEGAIRSRWSKSIRD